MNVFAYMIAFSVIAGTADALSKVALGQWAVFYNFNAQALNRAEFWLVRTIANGHFDSKQAFRNEMCRLIGIYFNRFRFDF